MNGVGYNVQMKGQYWAATGTLSITDAKCDVAATSTHHWPASGIWQTPFYTR